MLFDKKIVVVMPAYNAAKTLARTYSEIPKAYVDEVILVDDKSNDETARIANELGITTIVHDTNLGYGANQKTCYRAALSAGADVVVMLHPDYQYTPKLIVPMAALVANGQFDAVLGSRFISEGAYKNGMPLYKYVANRFLTWFENVCTGKRLSEYHTGYRAFSRAVLETLPLSRNSNDFIFDNQMLAEALYFGYHVGEVSCPARYFPEASSINFMRSIRYGFGVVITAVSYRLHRLGVLQGGLFQKSTQDQ
ncbi:glycosyl transferase family 2 [Candidatus Uhrbacteria bacterium CG10_big_fil_rev_8_21_14_0_10_48_11]|uniref:Glycosyl transferase family 2 n=1 Tax=Candidatus Uhrbacteria bacterium CG10_big_fil_rev_8_21_14_0_10_48_11 TaxID=1975037 RepID=A0A2M8LEK1_9BACT|nr:MAG: glycosyl transferase family 2 [Candidatus Uhrbacteria bacterium CG10_big_fil_rev_8_21_14_0_10_48_11]